MKKIDKKYIYFILALILIFLYLKFIKNMDKNNNDSTNNQKAKEVILSEETLKELDSLNERIDSITVKNGIKFGRVIENKKKETNKSTNENEKK